MAWGGGSLMTAASLRTAAPPCTSRKAADAARAGATPAPAAATGAGGGAAVTDAAAGAERVDVGNSSGPDTAVADISGHTAHSAHGNDRHRAPAAAIQRYSRSVA